MLTQLPAAHHSLLAPIINAQKYTKRAHFSPPSIPATSSRHFASPPKPSRVKSPFPQNPTMSATSPPHSPLPKRQKPNPTSPSQSTSIEATMSTAEKTAEAIPVTKVSGHPPLLIKKLSEKARLPTRGSAFAAGYDLYAAKDTVVPARGKVLVDTDISMAVPEGTCLFPSTPTYLSSDWILF